VVGSVWFELAPWLAFGAALVIFYLWMRRPPRPHKPPRRPATALSPGRRDHDQVAEPQGGKTRPL
jgi:hypothetical protein